MEKAVAEKNDWQAESDMRTLIEAKEIRSDKSRLRRALAKAKELQQNMQKVLDDK